jgi:hypothetical protein
MKLFKVIASKFWNAPPAGTLKAMSKILTSWNSVLERLLKLDANTLVQGTEQLLYYGATRPLAGVDGLEPKSFKILKVIC